MIERGRKHPVRWHWLAGTLTLLLALTAIPALGSEDSTSVSVEAVISGETLLTLEICDTTADFGEGLNFAGEPVTGTSDEVSTIAGPASNAFYVWTPSCPLDTSFVHIESSTPGEATVCVSENLGASSVGINRLRWMFEVPQPITFEYAVSGSSPFPLCSDGPLRWTSLAPGTFDFDFLYLLLLDSADTPGTFSTTTVWEVSS